jgi:hypothetical protein
MLSFPRINTLSSLPNIQLFGDAELDIVVLISHAVIVCILQQIFPGLGCTCYRMWGAADAVHV